MKRIVLMGFMGAGKSTVGKHLAEALSCEFIDTDEWIEKEQGRKISEIFAKEGEVFFRNLETDLLKTLRSREGMFVLSVGGGMPLREENRKLLQETGEVIYLKTSKDEIIKRVSGDTSRPLLQGDSLEKKITSLMNEREEVYLSAAHKQLVTDEKSVSCLVREILNFK